MFGLGLQELLILAVLGIGGAVVLAVVLVANSSGGRGLRERPPDDE
jgi:hypothetical protein